MVSYCLVISCGDVYSSRGQSQEGFLCFKIANCGEGGLGPPKKKQMHTLTRSRALKKISLQYCIYAACTHLITG